LDNDVNKNERNDANNDNDGPRERCFPVRTTPGRTPLPQKRYVHTPVAIIPNVVTSITTDERHDNTHTNATPGNAITSDSTPHPHTQMDPPVIIALRDGRHLADQPD
jgi:hypothetical protein